MIETINPINHFIIIISVSSPFTHRDSISEQSAKRFSMRVRCTVAIDNQPARALHIVNMKNSKCTLNTGQTTIDDFIHKNIDNTLRWIQFMMSVCTCANYHIVFVGWSI